MDTAVFGLIHSKQGRLAQQQHLSIYRNMHDCTASYCCEQIINTGIITNVQNFVGQLQ